jgi:hypothetical protein
MQGPKVKEAKKRGQPLEIDKEYTLFKHRWVLNIIGKLNKSLNPNE